MQIFEAVLALHIYSLYASGALMIFYLFLTQGPFKAEFNFIRKIRLFLPIYYLFLSLILFTGLVLLALLHFHLSVKIIFMICSWILILSLNIFQYKLFKKARRFRRYAKFRAFSFFILIFCIALITLPFFNDLSFLDAIFNR